MAFDFRDGRGTAEVKRLYQAVAMALMSLSSETPDATRLAGFRMGLRGIPIDAIERACGIAAETMERPPRPVDLRRLAGEHKPEQAALIAWEKALDAVSKLGPYRHVTFDDGTTNAVIRSMGGWPVFCGRFGDAGEEKWVRQEFIKTHLSLSGVNGDACRPLSGLSQATVRGGKVVKPLPAIIRTGLPPSPVAIDVRPPAAIEHKQEVPKVEFSKP